MIWCRIGEKQLSKPMSALFVETYMSLQETISLKETNYLMKQGHVLYVLSCFPYSFCAAHRPINTQVYAVYAVYAATKITMRPCLRPTLGV